MVGGVFCVRDLRTLPAAPFVPHPQRPRGKGPVSQALTTPLPPQYRGKEVKLQNAPKGGDCGPMQFQAARWPALDSSPWFKSSANWACLALLSLRTTHGSRFLAMALTVTARPSRQAPSKVAGEGWHGNIRVTVS